MKGLKIKEKWLNLILLGDKTWEIRGNNCNIRGRIGLVQCGSSMVYGEINMIGAIPLDRNTFINNRDKHHVDISWEELLERYKTPYAWIMEDVESYKEPKKFKNLQGSVKWVNIDFI